MLRNGLEQKGMRIEMKEYLKNILIGAVIGVANIIPGVSGGTMMVILNVFDKLVNAVSSLRREWRKSIRFLSAILLRAGAALLLLSGGINWLLDHHYMITNLFFVGVIVGSFPMIWKKISVSRVKPASIIPGLVTLAIMLATVYTVPAAADRVITELSLPVFFQLMACSAVAAFCMIIPGISGSFVMVLFGVYHTVTAAISSLNLLILIPVGIGVLIGILLGSKLIAKLLARFPQASYFGILGFMVGSIPAIYQKIAAADAFVGGWSLVIGILVFLLGGTIAYLFSSESFQEKMTRGRNS